MSRKQPILNRQLAAKVIVAAACLLIAFQYIRMIQPAAAREIKNACKGLNTSAKNPQLGPLPSSEPVDFTALNHEGQPVSLSDYRGKVVLVNFWATWCKVCESEKPGLEEMAAELRSDDFEVLTLASNSDWREVHDYAAEKFPDGASFDVLLDPPKGDDNLGEIARSWGLSAVPETFVIDREGQVQFYFINKRDWNSDVALTCLRGMIDA
ncbi:MAG: TlpA family protein disulfide reductase [Proteobacteria bacterium]|nr:TlpA family protein disulfide reductase [Pseudomonadota bacterium]